MYALRRNADYELSPSETWRRALANADLAYLVAKQARQLAASVDQFDFTPVLHLF